MAQYFYRILKAYRAKLIQNQQACKPGKETLYVIYRQKKAESFLFHLPQHLMNGDTVRLDGFGLLGLSFHAKGQIVEKALPQFMWVRNHTFAMYRCRGNFP